jgi:DNA-binding response OmpR family regulator
MEKILVVNNDIDTMSLLTSWLEKKSYTVKYTGNKQEVPSLAKEFDPQLVMVDVLQKEVIEQLKDDDETRTIPVLLMTGHTFMQKNFQVPADDTIEKPFNLNLLERKIERLIA